MFKETNSLVLKLLKDNLNIAQTKLKDLTIFFQNNGSDKVREHCCDLRIDVDLATEKRILQIQEQRDEMLREIDQFENKCLKELGLFFLFPSKFCLFLLIRIFFRQ